MILLPLISTIRQRKNVEIFVSLRLYLKIQWIGDFFGWGLL